LVSGPDAGRQALFEQLAAFRAAGQPGPGLKQAAAPFRFGSAVTLRHLTSAKEAATFTFQPAPARQQAAGDVTSFSFHALPGQADIPVLAIEAVVPVRAFAPCVPAAPIDIGALTRATEAWPANNAAFASLVEPLRSLPPLSRMEQALKLTRQKIRFSHEGMGTRYGAVQALARGRGHCWDFSDIYITLSRAAGLPARQVGGWVAGMSGHVWSEVFIGGQGWIAVDSTTSWTGVSDRYVPLWQSEDGVAQNFVWWAVPKLERR
jgi:transglutaminase-like putative cysteine protease